MYAVVKAGGKQHKVAVGDVVEVNRLEGDAGDAVNLPALLLVDGRTVTSEASALAKIVVTGEIVGHHKGPKIKILKYKNKTGYRKRIGHRQLLTELLVTDIDDGTPKKKAKAEPAKSQTKADTDEKPTKAAAKTQPTKAANAAKGEPAKATAKADADEKPAKAAKTATKASAKADTEEKPAKTAKATPAKATTTKATPAKATTTKATPAKATKPASKATKPASKATKAKAPAKATKASPKASDTDEKKD